MIPLIDIEPFLLGSAADKVRTAEALDDACREFGWLVVAGHGVPNALIEEMHAVSRAFFARPHWEKMKHKMPADRYRGYTPPGTESLAYSLDEEGPPDLKEGYSMGPVDAACDEYHYGPAGARYFAPNIWPDRPDDMPRVWEAYYREMSRLSADMMRIFAVALDMPEDFFQPKIDEHITNFSAIYYPSQPTRRSRSSCAAARIPTTAASRWCIATPPWGACRFRRKTARGRTCPGSRTASRSTSAISWPNGPTTAGARPCTASAIRPATRRISIGCR